MSAVKLQWATPFIDQQAMDAVFPQPSLSASSSTVGL